MVGLALAFCFLGISRISVAFVLRRLKPLIVFMIPFFLLLPLSITHDPEQGIRISWIWANELLATVLAVRAVAIAITVFPMLGTAPFHVSMKSLQDVGFPRMLIQAVLFTYRYLFVYLDQLRKMGVATRSRGFRPGFDRRSFKIYGYQVGMLLVTSFEQTERILNAMKSRGYDGTIRILYKPERVRMDWWKFAGILMLTLVMSVGDRLCLK